MASLAPGLRKWHLHFWQLWRDEKIVLCGGPELKLQNYESVQHMYRIQFSGIKKGGISFHRHFKSHSYKSHLSSADLSIPEVKLC